MPQFYIFARLQYTGIGFTKQTSSILDHSTLATSGPLPPAFLQGCGLNDWEIEATKLYDQRLTSSQVTDIRYRIHHLHTDSLIPTRQGQTPRGVRHPIGH